MTALIITIIAILLVGALALATVYFGGSSWAESRKSADAVRLVNEGAQVKAAVELHRNQYSVGVDNLQELVDKEFLSKLPPSSWNSVNGYAVSVVSDAEMCLEANRKLGVSGVPHCSDPRIANSTLCCTMQEPDNAGSAPTP